MEVLIMMTIRQSLEIKNKLGIHARAAVKFVNISTQYKSKIMIERDGIEVDGKSLLSILTLACPKGSWITIVADGADAEQALESLEKLIDDKFGED